MSETTFTSVEGSLEPALAQDAEYNAWLQGKVEAGEQAYREGRFITQEEATTRAEKRRAMILGNNPSNIFYSPPIL